MILALMPGHLRALTSNQTISHDRIDYTNQAEDAEWSQVLASSTSSALITPFSSRTGKGVITIGGSTGWVADKDTRQFVQLAAILLSICLAKSEGLELRHTETIKETTSSIGIIDSALDRQSQVRSAMTGLMGSIELLESDPTAENNLEGCLRIMRTSVSKLISLTSDPIPDMPPTSVSKNRTGLPTGILESI